MVRLEYVARVSPLICHADVWDKEGAVFGGGKAHSASVPLHNFVFICVVVKYNSSAQLPGPKFVLNSVAGAVKEDIPTYIAFDFHCFCGDRKQVA